MVLLVADDVDHAVKCMFVKSLDRSPEVLGGVDARPIGAQHGLLAHKPDSLEVEGDRPGWVALEDAPLEPFGDEILAEQVRLRLPINLLEPDPEPSEGGVEAQLAPAVEAAPQGVDKGIASLPRLKEIPGGAPKLAPLVEVDVLVLARRVLRVLRLKGLLEADVEITDEVVALPTDRHGVDAFTPTLVREHRLADVYAPIVDEVDAPDIRAHRPKQRRDRRAEDHVARVPEVKRLIGVGRAVLDEDLPTDPEVRAAERGVVGQRPWDGAGGDGAPIEPKVEEPLHGLDRGDERVSEGDLCQRRGDGLGTEPQQARVGVARQGEIAGALSGGRAQGHGSWQVGQGPKGEPSIEWRGDVGDDLGVKILRHGRFLRSDSWGR